jgi:hypothetical protein
MGGDNLEFAELTNEHRCSGLQGRIDGQGHFGSSHENASRNEREKREDKK